MAKMLMWSLARRIPLPSSKSRNIYAAIPVLGGSCITGMAMDTHDCHFGVTGGSIYGWCRLGYGIACSGYLGLPKGRVASGHRELCCPGMVVIMRYSG